MISGGIPKRSMKKSEETKFISIPLKGVWSWKTKVEKVKNIIQITI